ncbi:MAG: peptide chain release factor N(5)-glutamine methyltransferase [Bacteroidaceae bacterium]
MKELKKEIRNALEKLYSTREIQAIQRQLLTSWLAISDIDYYCDKYTELSIEQRAVFNEMLIRLGNAEPIQYVLGYTYFYGHRLYVDQNVLIPRPETEELVKLIEEEIIQNKKESKDYKILDIGTGSGAIIIALATTFPQGKFIAIDISETALLIAKRNALSCSVKIDFHKKDILEQKLEENESTLFSELDIIVSNPPYICEQEQVNMNNNVIKHEPHLALFVDNNDALLFYREIAKHGKKMLKKGGKLFFEINQQFGLETKQLLESMDYHNVCLYKDQFHNDRFIVAQKD